MINPTDYINAVISQSFKDEHLRPEYREDSNMVHFESGQMAFVFKLYNEDAGKFYAAKLYSDPDRLEYDRIKAIERYIRNLGSDYFVDYSYEEDFIYVDQDGLPEDEKVKPAVLMEWVEGRTLGEVVKELCTKKDFENLSLLTEKFRELALFLLEKDFAHGDLKHDNIIVDDSFNLKLVDYDGMFIPEFAGQKSIELGTRAFQHPMRSANDFDRNLDDFSILIIYTSLVTLSSFPELYSFYEGSENLLFRYEDFLNPDTSSLFLFLQSKNEFSYLISTIQYCLNLRVNDNDIISYVILHSKETMNTTDIFKYKLNRIFNYIYNNKAVLKVNFDDLAALNKIVMSLDEGNKIYVRQKERVKLFLIRNANTRTSNGDQNSFVSYLVSRYYSLDFPIIHKFEKKFNWKSLSGNESIKWSNGLIETYKDQWDWFQLSRNKSIPWNNELIAKYIESWDWKGLSGNVGIPWTDKLIERFQDRWNWEELTDNTAVQLNIRMIEKYHDKWLMRKWDIERLVRIDPFKWPQRLIEKIDWMQLSYSQLLNWSDELIETYKEQWVWFHLSRNRSIPWNAELIAKYVDKWYWHALSANEYLPWSDGLIGQFYGKWDWMKLCENVAIQWDINLIEKYQNEWMNIENYWSLLYSAEEKFWMGICENTSLKLSIELLERYQDSIHWDILSSNETSFWTEDLIDKFESYLDFEKLSYNEGLPWSEQLIERYLRYWNWSYLSKNESIPWSVDLIKKFKDKWSWFSLSYNCSLPWSFEFINEFRFKWDWEILSQNTQLPWSEQLIETFKNQWTWKELFFNDSIIWTERLIDIFKNKIDEDKWNWNYLSTNKLIPWTLRLIQKYENNWSWSGLSANESLPWSDELIEMYIDRWALLSFRNNAAIPWSISLLEKYEDKWNAWDWSYFCEKIGFYNDVFKHYLDDEMIDEILENIE